MGKKALFIFLILAVAAGTVFSRDYRLDDQKAEDLAGIDTVIFDMGGISCALCIRTMEVSGTITGGGRGSRLELGLTGEVTSNRREAVPALYTERQGRTLKIRLFPREQTFFGLSQSGTARFTGVLPDSFRGEVKISSSSGDLTAENLAVRSLLMEASSGDVRVSGVRADLISADLSSGNLTAGELEAREELELHSSSGGMTLGRLQARGRMDIQISSGHIAADSLSGGEVFIHSSSGRIRADRLEARRGILEISSGDVTLGTLSGGEMSIDQSSGRLKIQRLEAERLEIETSGDVEILSGRGELICRGSSSDVTVTLDSLEDQVDVDVSSGNVELTLPEKASFSLSMETSSGRILSDFPVLGIPDGKTNRLRGTVNGGGPEVRLETSSGSISLRAD